MCGSLQKKTKKCGLMLATCLQSKSILINIGQNVGTKHLFGHSTLGFSIKFKHITQWSINIFSFPITIKFNMTIYLNLIENHNLMHLKNCTKVISTNINIHS